jgi:EAL domain-containing protein (putative c-di-GMP-specific phosphodiesterase class I)
VTASALDGLLKPGAISVVFQPIFELRGARRQLHSVEALSRGPIGTHLERANVLFEYARRKGAEVQVDRACLVAIFAALGGVAGQPVVSVNVHASTMGRDPEFPSFLADLAADHGVDLSRMTVEVVEHALPWDMRCFESVLAGLRDIGIRIALDDIGLGQSNYRMMLEVRPDYFKVDRYVVAGCHRDDHRRTILRSLLEVARGFGGRVVAEGIEDPADLQAVASLGIDLVQGFLLAQPVAASGVPAPGWAGLQLGRGPRSDSAKTGPAA